MNGSSKLYLELGYNIQGQNLTNLLERQHRLPKNHDPK